MFSIAYIFETWDGENIHLFYFNKGPHTVLVMRNCAALLKHAAYPSSETRAVSSLLSPAAYRDLISWRWRPSRPSERPSAEETTEKDHQSKGPQFETPNKWAACHTETAVSVCFGELLTLLGFFFSCRCVRDVKERKRERGSGEKRHAQIWSHLFQRKTQLQPVKTAKHRSV